MAIELPRRFAGSPGRRRGRGAPTIDDVPQVRQSAVGAPRVPDVSRTVGGVEAGRALQAFGATIAEAAERQQRQFDLTAEAEAELEFDREVTAEYQRRQTEDDPSRPDFLKSFDEFMDERAKAITARLPAGVSPDASRRLRVGLTRSAVRMAREAGNLHLAATENRTLSTITDLSNKWSAQAERYPDELATVLTEAETRLQEFASVLRPEAEDRARRLVRVKPIEAAVAGLVKADRYKDAEALIASGAYDADLDATTLARINADIQRGRSVARSALRTAADDHVASLASTGVGVAGVSETAGRVLEADELAAFRAQERDARRVFSLSQEFIFAEPGDITAALEAVRPQPGSPRFASEQRMYAGLLKRADDLMQERDRDPAGYANRAPEVRAAYAEAAADPARLPAAIDKSLSLQGHIGIPEHARQPLPAAAARQEVDRLAALPAGQFAETIAGMSVIYGKHWPKVYRQLVAEKLPAESLVIGTLDAPGDAPVRRDLAGAMQTGRKTLADNLPPDIKTDIDKSLQDAFSHWARLELARGATDRNVQAMRSAAELLAYSYAARGMTPFGAANQAVSRLVLDRYDFVTEEGFALYVPKGLAGKIVPAGKQALANLTAADLADIGGEPNLTPEQRRAEYLKIAKRGRWVLNETGDGAFLVDELAQPVMRADGSRVDLPFSEMDKVFSGLPSSTEDPRNPFRNIAPPSGRTPPEARP